MLFLHVAPLALLCLCVALVSAGCRTGPTGRSALPGTPLPPADFSSPGWRVQEGQAIWKPRRGKPELAGELLLATNPNGDCFVQFSKPPFPLTTAQVRDGRWQIEFGAGERAWRGHGEPSARFVWFQLPRALADEPLGRPWTFSGDVTDSWRLENPGTGETLEGRVFP